MDDRYDLVATERRSIVELLDSLTATEWDQPSLCAGWRVREVAAHLTMGLTLSVPSLLVRLVAARGDFHVVNDRFAKTTAKRPTDELVATIRDHADSHFHPPFLGPEAPLSDNLIHGLDIGVPLGRLPATSSASLEIVLGFLCSPKAAAGFVPKGRTEGLSFVADDVEFASGTGLAVHGPATSIVLALAGRSVGLPALRGEGVPLLAERIG